MKKFVIYEMSNLSIVSLTDTQPNFSDLKDTQDFDTTENWMLTDTGREALENFK